MDVHDVPSASKPINNSTIVGIPLGHESFYTYLRLRLPLETGMVVVSKLFIRLKHALYIQFFFFFFGMSLDG